MKAILRIVQKLFKALWPLLLVIAIIYFAPAIGLWLGSVGAPTWLSAAFTWVGTTVTPLLTSALSSLWSGVTGLASSAWTAFKGAELGTQLAIGLGAAALLAPEETGEFVEDAVETVVGVVTGVAGAVASGVASAIPTAVWVGGAALLAFMLFSDSNDEGGVTYVTAGPEPSSGNAYLDAWRADGTV